MTTETVYLGHDNSINLVLTEGNDAQALNAATKMTVTLGAITIESINGPTAAIRWAQTGYAPGEVRLYLGHQAISPGTYSAPLVVYDTTNTEGVVWTSIPIEVKAEVENA